MKNLYELHTEIAKIAPINGVSCGSLADKSTWRIDFSNTATPEQIQAANDFIKLETTILDT